MIKSIVAVSIVDSKYVGFDGVSSFAAVVLDWDFTKLGIFLKSKEDPDKHFLTEYMGSSRNNFKSIELYNFVS